MRFVHPEFLWFLFFALVPIILFFLNLQKVVRVDFTNVDFIDDIKKDTSNRFQLKRLLIALFRTLFVIFFVLAFAQPTFKSEEKITPKHHIVYFDNSLSMTRTFENGQLLDRAKVLLEQVISVKNGDKYSLITNSEQKIAQDFPSKIDLLKEVSKINHSNSQLPFSEVLALARRKKTSLNKQLVVVSDFQKSHFNDQIIQSLLDSTKLSYQLLSLKTEENNVFIDTVWIEDKYLGVGAKVNVNARLVNMSNSTNEVLIKCYSKGNQVSSVVVKPIENGKTTFSLETPLSSNGAVDFRLEVEDSRVLFDNDYHFVLNVGETINALILKGKSKSFVEVALANEPLFKVNSYIYTQFNSSEFKNADVIFIENVSELRKLPLSDLKDYMKKGGSVVFIPSIKNNVKEINKVLTSLQLFPVGASEIKEKKEIDVKSLEKTPFFKGVFEKTNKKIINPWYIPSFTVTRGKGVIQSKVGNSFLSVINNGRGKFYLFNTPFSESSTNFHRHSLFVPTQYLLAMSSTTSGENLSFSTSQKRWLIKDLRPSSSESYSMVNSNSQFVPEQFVKGNDLEVMPNPDMSSGVYDLRSRRSKIGAIAVNYGRKESYLEQQDLSSLKGIKNIELIEFDSDFKVENDEASVFPWWKWLILVALFWLFVETVLIRFFK